MFCARATLNAAFTIIIATRTTGSRLRMSPAQHDAAVTGRLRGGAINAGEENEAAEEKGEQEGMIDVRNCRKLRCNSPKP